MLEAVLIAVFSAAALSVLIVVFLCYKRSRRRVTGNEKDDKCLVMGKGSQTVPNEYVYASPVSVDPSSAITSIMSYSSSSLDDPLPKWTAYSPKGGVAWAPTRTHSYPEEGTKPRRSNSIFTIHGSLSSVLGSMTNLLGTPKLARKKSLSKLSLPMNGHVENGVCHMTHHASNGSLVSNVTPLPGRRRHSHIPRTHSRLSLMREPSLESLAWDDENLLPGEVFSTSEKGETYNNDFVLSEDDVFRGPGPPIKEEEEQEEEDESVNKTRHSDKSGALQTFLNMNDLTSVLLERQCLRTGRLLLRGPNVSICTGTLKTNSHRSYPSYARPVCIQIYRSLNSDEDRVNVLKNVCRLRQLRHCHVLEVLGVVTEGSPETRDGVEMLLATGRTHFQVTLHRLLSWTRDNNPELLTPRCATTFAIQICQGCRYLEQQRVVHASLMASNVMLDSKCMIRLAGIEEHPLSTRGDSTRWMALETLRDSSTTYKSVVWSFGVVMWEMLTLGNQPYPHLRRPQDVYLYLAKGKRLIRPDSCAKDMYCLLLACWHEKTRDRPTFDNLITWLHTLQKSLPPSSPPEELFPDRDDFWEDEYI